MDPVTQVLAQQQSGSTNGEGFGQFAVAGQQAGLARRRLDLEQQQERRQSARQNMLLPLEAELMKQQAANLGASVSFQKAKADVATQQNMAMPELVDLQVRFMQSPQGFKDAGLIQNARELSGRYPAAFVPGAPGYDLMTQVLAVPMLEQRWDMAQRRLKDLQGVAPAGTFVQSFDPKDGSFSFGQQRASATAVPGQLSGIGKELADYRALLEAGDTEGAAMLKAKIVSDADKNGFAIEFDDQGKARHVQFGGTKGAAQDGLTTTMQSEVQRKLVNADTAIAALDRGMDAVRAYPEGVGASGKIRSGLEIARGMLNPRGEVEMPSTKVQQELAKTFQQISSGLRVDTGNMSRYELQQLENLGKEDVWLTSPQKVLQTYEGLRTLSVAAKVRAQKQLGQRVDAQTLAQLPADEVTRMFSGGLLDVNEAIRALKAQVESNVISPAKAAELATQLQAEARKLSNP